MTELAEPRTRKGGFQHDVSHLQALWRREGVNVLAMAASRFTVAEIVEGLACYHGEREVGPVTVCDGVVTASPPFKTGAIFPDRVTPGELAAWLISTAVRLPGGMP